MFNSKRPSTLYLCFLSMSERPATYHSGGHSSVNTQRGESTSTTPIPSAPSSPCPGGNTTDIISRNNHSNSGSGGGGGGGQGGRGGGGASRRRQRAEEKNLTVLPGVCTHRRTQRSLSPLAKVPSRGRSTVTRPPSARSQAARSSGVKVDIFMCLEGW